MLPQQNLIGFLYHCKDFRLKCAVFKTWLVQDLGLSSIAKIKTIKRHYSSVVSRKVFMPTIEYNYDRFIALQKYRYIRACGCR